MASKRAGVISIALVSSSAKLQSEANAASARLGQLGVAAQTAGRNVGRGMAAGADGVRRLGGEAAKSTSAVVELGTVTLHTAEAAASLAAAHALAVAAMAKYNAGATASSVSTGQLANEYRALRIVLSPTVFTAASIGVGILAEETIRLVNARAQLIEQQSLFAAKNQLSFQSVDSLDTASRISAKDGSQVRGLFADLQSRRVSNNDDVQAGLKTLGVSGSLTDPAILGKIAVGFDAMVDPVKRAEAAFQIFGSSSGQALDQLDAQFAKGSSAVTDYALKLDEISRTQIYQFRKQFVDLRNEIASFGIDFAASFESEKQTVEQFAAALDDMSRRGINSLNNLVADYVPGMAALRAAIHGVDKLPSVPRADVGQDLATTELNAQAKAARDRQSQTLEGQQKKLEEYRSRAEAASRKLELDDANRERLKVEREVNPGVNPNIHTLSADARLAISLEQQSAAGLAAVTERTIAGMEAAKAIQRIMEDARHGVNEANVTLQAAGKSPDEKFDIKSKAAADEAVRAANKQLRDEHPDHPELQSTLSQSQAQALRGLTLTKEQTDREAEWRNEVASTVEAIKKRIQVQEVLNTAIGKGIEATKAAAIEGQLIEKFGEDYKKPSRQADVAKARTQLTVEGQGKDSGELQKQGEELLTNLKLELQLADAQLKGADAVTAVHHAETIRLLEAKGLSDLVDLENALFDARKRSADNAEAKANLDAQQESIDRLDLEIEGEKALAAAQLHGAEAVRKQALENKLAMLDYDSASTKVFDTLSARTKQLEDLKNQTAITKEALSTSAAYSDQLESLNKQWRVVAEIELLEGKNRDTEIDRERIEDQINQTLARQALATGTLKDGYRAFFTEIGTEAEKPGKILYDGMHSAVDRTSDELSKVLTGQKANWGKAFQDVGQQIVKQTTDSAIKKGLGELGKLFPNLTARQSQAKHTQAVAAQAANNPSGINTQDGQSESSAWWVRVTGNAQSGTLLPGIVGVTRPQSNKSESGGPRYGSGDMGGFIFSLFRGKKTSGNGANSEPWKTPTDDVGGLKRRDSGLIDRTGTPGPTGNSGDPVHVIQDAGSNNGLDLSKLLSSGAGSLGKLGGWLNSLGGEGGEEAAGGAGEAVSSLFSSAGEVAEGFAAGTDATPVGSAYWVGERGPELEINNQPHTVVPLDKIGGGSVGDIHYHIDARNADLGAAGRIKQALAMTHARAVKDAAAVVAEQAKRTPRGTR